MESIDPTLAGGAETALVPWPLNHAADPELEAAPVEEVAVPDAIALAVQAFLNAGFADGVTIPHGWFYETLGIPMPSPSMAFEEAKELNFRYMGAVSHLKTALLCDHSIALKSIRSEGYAIVPPAEQPSWAKKHLDKELSEAFRTASARASFVRMEGLTDAEKNAATATQASINTMRAHITAARATAKRRGIF